MLKKQWIPQLRFSEFEGNWEEKKLGEICVMTSSKRVYLEDYVEYGIPFFRGKEITELKNNKKPSNILYITHERYNEFKKKYGVPQKDDILITAVGTLGNVWKINDNKPFYFKDGNLIWLKNIYENSDFLEKLIQLNTYKLIKTSIGSTQKALTMVELRKIKLNFPLQDEQQKIASFLTAIDAKITQLTKKKALLETYKKGIMQKVFSQEIRFKDANGKDFPDWEEKKLGEVGQIIGGGTPSTTNEDYWNGEIQWFTPTEIKSDFVHKSKRTITKLGLQKSSAKILPIGTILLTTRATIGEISIANEECSTNQGFQSIIVNKNNNNIFIANWIKKNKHLLIRNANGSTFIEISKTEIQKIGINKPCLKEQTKIANFLSELDTKIAFVETQIENTTSFKKGLLQQMFV